MKKTIIAASIIISSGLTAFFISKAETKSTTSTSSIKIEKVNTAALNSSNNLKSDISSAD